MALLYINTLSSNHGNMRFHGLYFSDKGTQVKYSMFQSSDVGITDIRGASFTTNSHWLSLTFNISLFPFSSFFFCQGVGGRCGQRHRKQGLFRGFRRFKPKLCQA